MAYDDAKIALIIRDIVKTNPGIDFSGVSTILNRTVKINEQDMILRFFFGRQAVMLKWLSMVESDGIIQCYEQGREPVNLFPPSVRQDELLPDMDSFLPDGPAQQRLSVAAQADVGRRAPAAMESRLPERGPSVAGETDASRHRRDFDVEMDEFLLNIVRSKEGQTCDAIYEKLYERGYFRFSGGMQNVCERLKNHPSIIETGKKFYLSVAAQADVGRRAPASMRRLDFSPFAAAPLQMPFAGQQAAAPPQDITEMMFNLRMQQQPPRRFVRPPSDLGDRGKKPKNK